MRPSAPLFRILLLAALVALFAVMPTFAGTAAPSAPAAPQITPSPAAASFLASLQPTGPKGLGAIFDSGCSSNADCPKNQLCCFACGFDGCETKACFAPVNGHCPLFQ
jgi:hypothetical protein